MKILKTIGVVLLVLFAIIIVVSALAPPKMKIEESIIIKAKPKVVFDELNDLKKWPKWSAWSQKDKDIKWSFSDTSSGQGANMSWESSMVGVGKQVIEVSDPNRHVITKLNFSGWQGDNYESFFIEAVPEGSKVTRSLEGAELKFFLRGFAVLMHKMVQKDYQQGLENLKSICEAKPQDIEMKIELKTIKANSGLAIMDTATSRQIGERIGADFNEIADYIKQLKGKQTGAPFAVYYQYKNDTMVFQAGIPTNKNLKENERIKVIKLNGGKVVVGRYQGSFENIGRAHESINKWIYENKLGLNGSPWEVYLTNPAEEPDQEKWITEIYYPVN